MTTLLDRLREALAPDFEVDRELASGGMGMVFLGRDVALDRRVAIKIMRPELATAAAAERFVREARALARVSHPSIVPVYRAGQSGGFSYYVMDYIEAETLADRLDRGRLPLSEVLKAGLDLLDALEVVHRLGMVHRDIKPSNIFLVGSQATLVDFGVAKLTSQPPETMITTAGRLVGTLAYMPPEQLDGAEVSPQTDLYALAMVLFQALTGRGWPLVRNPDEADWSGVRSDVRRALSGALAWSAGERYADAGTFRRALEAARPGPRRFRVVPAAGVVLGAVAAIVGYWRLTRQPPGPAVVAIERFAQRGATDRPWLGDSLARAVAHAMGSNPDFLVRGPGDLDTRRARQTLVLAGDVVGRGESLTVVVHSKPGGGSAAFLVRMSGVQASWGDLADALARRIHAELWNREQSPIADELPTRALPKSSAGMAAFLAAEQLYARARWAEAYQAYVRAAALDSTCLLCDWRIADVGRWLIKDTEAAGSRRYLAAIDSFPPRYRRLIEAGTAPRLERWKRLREATEQDHHFAPAWFALGDERFHRGPLAGYLRRDALEPLQRATVLRPDFAPAWEHRAWVSIAQGDSADARRAMLEFQRTSWSQDLLSLFIGALLRVGFGWRFTSETEAEALTRYVLGQPMIRAFPDLGVAPRYLLTFDAPRGVVWLGGTLAHWPERPELVPAGMLAQVYGLLALGKADSARRVARELGNATTDPEFLLFAAELDAAVELLDSGDVARRWPVLRGELEARMAEGGGTEVQRQRAAWMLTLLARRAGPAPEAGRYRARLDHVQALARFLDADAAALARDARRALTISDPLLALDSAGRGGDPFLRTMLHLFRAQWWVEAGNVEAAGRELRWHENSDFVGHGGAAAQAGEIDWAFGTLGRWRRARLLDRGDRPTPEFCRCLEDVVRLWSGAEASYAARARWARERHAALHCPPRT